MQLELPMPGGSAIRSSSLNEVSVNAGMNEQSVAVAVVVRDDGPHRSVLVVKRADGGDGRCPQWVFPGGKVKLGESACAAAKRELREETGVKASRPFLLGSRVHPTSGVNISYVAFAAVSGTDLSMEQDKICAAEWVSTRDALRKLGSTLYGKVSQYLHPAVQEPLAF